MILTRNVLISELQDKGFTYRDARKIVSAVVEVMTKTIKEKKKLDLPFGVLSMRIPDVTRRVSFGRIVRHGRTPRFKFVEHK